MKPKLICLTPIKNEAWVLDVFLKCTSLWADHIILADQNSTDRSREIALKYPKVILIENKSNEFDESIRQKLLIDEARKIEGPKILFALDADELFTSNYINSSEWQKILNSKPGEVFCFQWANIYPGNENYFPSSFYYPWVVNDIGVEHKNYVKWIHSMRIPYPIEGDKNFYRVKDFKVFHLAFLNERRMQSKGRFYQCVVKVREPKTSFISLYRGHNVLPKEEYVIPKEWLEGYEKQSIDIFKGLDLSEPYFWFDLDVVDMFKKYGFKKFRYLNIWNKKWMNQMSAVGGVTIEDPRNLFIKAMYFYLRKTQRFYPNYIIKGIDKCLKFFIRNE
jgi:hypothetical protein